MNDMHTPTPPAFNIERRHEVIETKCFGPVTINDVGADAFEQIAIGSQGDTTVMMRKLLCAAAVGASGERFTLDMLADLPARAFTDRILLLRSAARINGVSGDEVEKA